jgi:Fur family transcriptional regulator, ferric uptake regulator
VPVDLHETAAKRLRLVSQRYTTGRRHLVERLADAGQPLTIPDLLGTGGQRVPQSSAYRNLAVLEQAGVVRRIVTFGDFARYELAEDLTEHHHHLICAVCGSVQDFAAAPALERTLDRLMGQAGESSGFVADSHRLDLIGRCSVCA